MEPHGVMVGDMADPIDAPHVLATPGADEALTLADSLWRWLIDSGVKIVVILIGAMVITLVINWLLRRFFRTMVESSSKISSMTGAVVKKDPRSLKAAQQRREQRAETLSNVARNIVRMVVWAVAIVMILAEVGVQIAPIIASLGVIGLAAGIGAQTIIKDFVAGIVMLFEDLVAVGDWVDLEYAEGIVEEINLRATQVRDLNGVLWTVRNGEIIRIGNYTRGFATAVVVLSIDAHADDDLVTEVLERVTGQMATEPDWVEHLHGPANISGMLNVDANRYQRRIMIETAPWEQWPVERELRARIRAEFAKADIQFAMPRFVETVQQ